MSNRFDVSWLNLNNQNQMNYLTGQTSDIISSKWSGNKLTYSFLSNETDARQVYIPYLSYANPSFTEVNSVNQNSIKSAMELISRLVNVDFEQTTTGNGNIQIGTHNMAVAGYSSFPKASMADEGVIMIGKIWNTGSLEGQRNFNQAFVHELGHSLGLDHPTNTNTTQLLSMMSYNKTQSSAMGFSMLDILSLIKQYGVSANTDGINYIYNNNGGNYNQSFVGNNYYINSQDVRFSYYTNSETYVPSTSTVFGTRGVDNLDLSATSDGVNGVTYDGSKNAVYWLEGKLPGTTSYKILSEGGRIVIDDYRVPNIVIAPSDGVNLFSMENLTLTRADDTVIIGDDFVNISTGNGDDTIYGFKSKMTIDGGDGIDVLSLTGDYSLSGFDVVSGNEKMSLVNIEKVLINGTEYVPAPNTEEVEEVLLAFTATTGNDVFTSTDQINTVDYSAVTGMMSVNMKLSTAQRTMGSGTDTLIGINNYIGGSGLDSVQGNELSNIIYGNAGNDLLRGNGGDDFLYGGLGNDLLVGGLGKDTFVFDTDLLKNVDTITDFKVGDDKIALSSTIFTSLVNGVNTTNFLVTTGTTTINSTDHLIYQSTTGRLYYDQDGSGSLPSVHFATLSGLPALTHDDFLII